MQPSVTKRIFLSRVFGVQQHSRDHRADDTDTMTVQAGVTDIGLLHIKRNNGGTACIPGANVVATVVVEIVDCRRRTCRGAVELLSTHSLFAPAHIGDVTTRCPPHHRHTLSADVTVTSSR